MIKETNPFYARDLKTPIIKFPFVPDFEIKGPIKSFYSTHSHTDQEKVVKPSSHKENEHNFSFGEDSS